MTAQKFSTFSLLDLPSHEREVFLYISRNAPCEAASIAAALRRDISDVQSILAALIQRGRLRQDGDSFDVILGTVSARTSLPVQLWSAFLTTDRLYSEQEIAALRIAVPMLQFARARLSEFTDHGPGHAFRVKALATQLGAILDLTNEEHHLLRAGALFHDVGNVVDRGRHHIISQEVVEKLNEAGKLPFSPKEARLVGLLCRWHRKEADWDRTDTLRGKMIRTGLLASVLRVADAMDIDYRRSDQGKKFREVLGLFFMSSLPFWNSADEIFGVRFDCTSDVNIQVFTRGMVSGNLQIEMLHGDLASTPLKIQVREIPVEEVGPPNQLLTHPADQAEPGEHKALVVFPFEPHSLVMAGLSLRHLAARGYQTNTLCYANTPEATRRLWEEKLLKIEAKKYDRLIVVNDRPDASLTARVLQTIHHLQGQDILISVLNRHEASWQRVPQLVKLGVEIVLGGDWAYFWGTPVDASSLKWGKVASLCTRDPTQSTVDITDDVYAAMKGLLVLVYEAVSRANKAASANWEELARPILEHIIANDFAYFSRKDQDFSETYAKSFTPNRIEGRVAIVEQSSGDSPAVNYWMMEATIENYGRAPVRNMQFNLPYVLSIWSRGEQVELLAINHWRDDTAIPIRLLYPDNLGPPPRGNESTVRVTLPREKSALVIQALINTCNQTHD